MARSKGRSPQRKTSLAAFFRKLWSKPDLLARFSESRQGREEVLARFRLSARHKKLLVGGCMHDIIAELAGLKGPSDTIYISVVADLDCGHPECKVFTKAGKKR